MRQRIASWAGRVDALSLRERVLIFAGAAALLIASFNALFLSPLLAHKEALSAALTQRRTAASQANAEISAVDRQLAAAAHSHGGLTGHRPQGNLVAVSPMPASRQNGLMSPQQMPAFLQALLTHGPAVTVISLTTQAPLPLKEPGQVATESVADGMGAQNVAFYGHKLELKLSGSDSDLRAYLEALQRQPWPIYWAGIRIDASRSHNATLTLTIYTLSPDKTWLTL
ncbi:MAG: hypothetical protein M0T84_02485 [Betaproteobacteria bacterium]|nr:hypothetical protein [Betaproteobacteria bacterium]